MRGVYLWFEEFEKEVSEKLAKGKKFCFIIGAGASFSSGVPTGMQLVEMWHKDLKEGRDEKTYAEEIERRIEILKSRAKNYWKKRKIGSMLQKYRDWNYVPSSKNSQDDYNNLYDLRFAENPLDGQRFFYNLFENKLPSVGYFSLAEILSTTESDVLITTNFDSLVEIAIRQLGIKTPFSIGHEALAEYVISGISDMPRILKPHRDVLFGGFNRAEDIAHLKKGWKKALSDVLDNYIPIVVGYNGTDPDMFELLSQKKLDSIYWCYRYGNEPRKELVELIEWQKGRLVSIKDADQAFIALTKCFGIAQDDIWGKKKVVESVTLNSRYHMMDAMHNQASYREFGERAKIRLGETYKAHSANVQSKMQDWVKNYNKISGAPTYKGPEFIEAELRDDVKKMSDILEFNLKKGEFYTRGYFELAQCYFGKNDDMAEKNYLKVIEKAPYEFLHLCAKAYRNLCVISVRRNDRDGYLKWGEKYLELEPADSTFAKEYWSNYHNRY